jgi:hypothetical protein
MRRSTALGTGLAAGVAVLALVATPAVAQGPWSRTSTTATCNGAGTAAGRTPGPADGYGMGRGYGMGNGMGNGMGLGTRTPAAQGTLTDAQKRTLAAMAEEEKLAHDLYAALSAKYPDVVQFARIQRSETMHANAVRTLLTRYGITDPTVGVAAGRFTDTRLQGLYDDLLASATTADKALAAGVTIEKTDIADLTTALKGLDAPDVSQVLTTLRAASQQHLSAFGG